MAFCLAGALTSASTLILLMVAGSLVYVGGCYLGDAKDVEFDRANKPDRPIPSGILSRRLVWALGWSMMLGGLICFFYAGDNLQIAFTTGALPLAFCIVFYALLHKSTPILGLPLIGACRAMLIFSAYVAVSYRFHIDQTMEMSVELDYVKVGSAAIAMALYTICFASVARLESSDRKVGAPMALKAIMLFLPCSTFLYHDFSTQLAVFLTSLVLYTAWLSFAFREIHRNKGIYVSRCLAGFALLDMVLISPAGWVNALLCFGLFLAALGLQKWAPAT